MAWITKLRNYWGYSYLHLHIKAWRVSWKLLANKTVLKKPPQWKDRLLDRKLFHNMDMIVLPFQRQIKQKCTCIPNVCCSIEGREENKGADLQTHVHGFMFGKRFLDLFQGRSASVEARSSRNLGSSCREINYCWQTFDFHLKWIQKNDTIIQ